MVDKWDQHGGCNYLTGGVADFLTGFGVRGKRVLSLHICDLFSELLFLTGNGLENLRLRNLKVLEHSADDPKSRVDHPAPHDRKLHHIPLYF